MEKILKEIIENAANIGVRFPGLNVSDKYPEIWPELKPKIEIGKTGIVLVIEGNTYEYKQFLKKEGLKWNGSSWMKWYPFLTKKGTVKTQEEIFDLSIEAIEKAQYIVSLGG